MFKTRPIRIVRETNKERKLRLQLPPFVATDLPQKYVFLGDQLWNSWLAALLSMSSLGKWREVPTNQGSIFPKNHETHSTTRGIVFFHNNHVKTCTKPGDMTGSSEKRIDKIAKKIAHTKKQKGEMGRGGGGPATVSTLRVGLVQHGHKDQQQLVEP